MANNNFDDIIKDKLTVLADQQQVSDWSDFEQLLDEDQLSDQLFDDKVTSELRNMRSPFQEAHWMLLHDSLELQQDRNNRIIGYKIVEISMLFLLLLSGFNFLKFQPVGNINDHYSTLIADHSVMQDEGEQSLISILSQNVGISNEISSTGELVYTITESEIKSTENTDIKVNHQIESVQALSEINEVEEYNSIISSDHLNLDVKTTINTYNTIASLEGANDQNLEMLTTYMSPLDFERASIEVQQNTYLKIAPLKVSNKTSKSITAYIGLDNNLVNSPFDLVYDEKGYETYGLGYSMGAEYGIKKGLFEVGLGLEYSHRGYDPRYIGETYGSTQTNLFETGLTHIDFDILSIPLNIKYALITLGKWSVDVGLGTSANMVVFSKYEIQDKLLDPYGRLGADADKRALLIDDKPLHAGLFQGGTLRENLYYTVDFSLGFERRINEFNNLSLRPQYSIHTLSDGIGPNQDRIHNLSLNIGVKHLL